MFKGSLKGNLRCNYVQLCTVSWAVFLIGIIFSLQLARLYSRAASSSSSSLPAVYSAAQVAQREIKPRIADYDSDKNSILTRDTGRQGPAAAGIVKTNGEDEKFGADATYPIDGHDREPGKTLADASVERLLAAIALIESNNQSTAAGDGGKAAGVYQLHPVYVNDVNRIIGSRKYTLADRFDTQKSAEMAVIYLSYWGRRCGAWPISSVDDAVTLGRIHNGGPRGYEKEATVKYAAKLREVLNGQM